jgi:hypothetical protein
MTLISLPQPHPHPVPSVSEPGLGRRFLHAASYTAAVTFGLTAAPALVILSDRGTFLYWANCILDFVGSH